MEAEVAVHMQDMEEEGIEDEAEEDQFRQKNTQNTETEPNVQQHWKPKKIFCYPLRLRKSENWKDQVTGMMKDLPTNNHNDGCTRTNERKHEIINERNGS